MVELHSGFALTLGCHSDDIYLFTEELFIWNPEQLLKLVLSINANTYKLFLQNIERF